MNITHDFGAEIDFTPDWLAKLRAEAAVTSTEEADGNEETPDLENNKEDSVTDTK